jgi:hypothetical protein
LQRLLQVVESQPPEVEKQTALYWGAYPLLTGTAIGNGNDAWRKVGFSMSEPDDPRLFEAPRIRGSDGSTDGRIVAAWVTLALAVGFLIFGLYRMLVYDEYSDKIVGGDAYNYLILTERGIGFICAGIALAVIAAVLTLQVIAGRKSTG